jgi:hypothetical protein
MSAKTLFILIAAASFIFVLKKCSPSQAKEVAFSGTWKITEEDGITGANAVTTASVASDGRRFRVDARLQDNPYKQEAMERQEIQVYDGETLHTKYVSSGLPEEGLPAPEPHTTSQPATDLQAHGHRFWARSFSGKAGPGGQIAGRDTVLYQVRENRPEGELVLQAWVDKDTGLVMKSIATVYSTQIESMVSKVTHECQDVRYEAPDASAFSKP